MREPKFGHGPVLAGLTVVGLMVQFVLAWPIDQPGTMDAHYYYGAGRSLLQNGAFVEPVIWNYLGDPAGLPTPSHLYWMPLPSILVALSQAAFGPSFRAAQLPFVLLAAVLPAISYATARAFNGNRRQALVAGLLAVFGGFYLPYWSLPETFAPFAAAGSLALFCLGRWTRDRHGGWLLGAGLLTGLGHLCRADGLLLLGAGLLTTLILAWRRPRQLAVAWLALLAGYLVPMAPWFLRNWALIGAPLPSAGTQTLFLRTYDELFSYGTPLTLERYLAWGWGNILRSKLEAGWSAVQTFVAVNNLIFLTPFCLIGIWQARRRPSHLPALLYGVGLYGAMTLLFTFPGERGGLFHSSAALLPALFAVSLSGLDAAVAWVARRRRGWDRRGAQRFFSVGVVLLAAGVSFLVYSRRIIGDNSWANPEWNRSDLIMVQIGDWIKEIEGGDPTVMVGNPPAFFYHTGLPSIVVPNEPVEQTLSAARRYGAEFLVLDQNRPPPLDGLYWGKVDHPHLELVWSAPQDRVPRIVVYQILDP